MEVNFKGQQSRVLNRVVVRDQEFQSKHAIRGFADQAKYIYIKKTDFCVLTSRPQVTITIGYDPFYALNTTAVFCDL